MAVWADRVREIPRIDGWLCRDGPDPGQVRGERFGGDLLRADHHREHRFADLFDPPVRVRLHPELLAQGGYFEACAAVRTARAASVR